MTEAGPPLSGRHQIAIQDAKARLSENGGYEVVHQSPGLELGVYVLVAPEPDRQQPHDDDEVYVVLEGRARSTSRASATSSPKATPSSCRPAPSTASSATNSSACS